MAVQQVVLWNKDRIIGQKKPLQISHIWGIRIRLELEGKTRDLALYNLGLDSKLRGRDLVRLKGLKRVRSKLIMICHTVFVPNLPDLSANVRNSL